MESPLLVWRTMRRLRPRQIVAQCFQRVRPLVERPSAFARRRVPPVPPWTPLDGLPLPPPSAGAWLPAELRAGRFTFLDDTRDVGWPPRWDDDAPPLLWRYNLHYFDWLWALDYAGARQAVAHWLAHHPLSRRNVGWQPYPTSLRLMNWLVLFRGRFCRETESDPEFLRALWAGLYVQTEWLARHVETHIQANHLLENAVALALMGSRCDTPAAGAWLQRGLALLARELPEQFLPDGLHYERSPMYHQRMLYLLLLLWTAGPAELRPLVAERLTRGAAALRRLLHPDGDIALLNDSAFGIYTPPADLLRAAAAACPAAADAGAADTGGWALPDAGYYGWRGADGSYLVMDAGAIGPDYQPGHAHGDMLSFELALGGRRVIVDAGVHDYLRGNLRRYCRSTRAHNTVELDGQDQCEFWADFCVARRGRPHDVAWSGDAEGCTLSAWHDGYGRLRGAPRHARRFAWAPGRGLEVRDRITSRAPHAAVSRVHLHPDCRVTALDAHGAAVSHPGGAFRVAFTGAGTLRQEPSHYCPRFGVDLENVCLAFESRGANVEFGFDVLL